MTPYTPDPLPPAGIDYGPLVGLVGRANAELARYDGLLQGIVNPGVLLSPLTTQEAVLSSRIEGTQATLDEVLEHEAGQPMPPEKSQDIQEIANYRAALIRAAEELAHRPISLSLVKQMHALLMDSVRGADRQPGQFRIDQNWVGPPGCVIEEATFVPPSPLRFGGVGAVCRSYGQRRHCTGGDCPCPIRADPSVQRRQRAYRSVAHPVVPGPAPTVGTADVLSLRLSGGAPGPVLSPAAGYLQRR